MSFSRFSVKTPRGWKQHSLNRNFGGRFRIPVDRGRPSKKPRRRLKKAALFLILSVFLLTAAGAFSGALFFIWIARDLPDPANLSARTVAQSTKIYDRKGETLLYEIHGEKKRTSIPLKEIPEHVRLATVLVEDKDFYTHGGFALRGILRALMVNLLSGEKLQGGSTITQQLVKNSILSREKTYTRKIRELILAYQIEKQMSKDSILELYLNEIPYGSTSYGIEAASQSFFGKPTKDLDIAEAAMLAALPKAPTYYSPYGSHADELVARARHIINLLEEGGYVSAEEAERAKKINLLARVLPKREQILAPHFVFYVKEKLADMFGERVVEQGGLKVITTLNLDKQKIAEEAIAAQAKENEKKYGARNAALVSIDVKSGDVLAMVGSRDYFDTENDGNVNVTIRPRQPGSSFKPIVYAAAFEKGYTPDTILFDVETVFKTELKDKDYEPKNYGGKIHGPVTARRALAGSLNIPAVKLLYLTGMNNVLDLADSLDYSTLKDRSRFGLSLVLGGGEVQLLEHTAAFGAFAREGVSKPASAILKVEDTNGSVLFEKNEPQKKNVFSPQTARLISNILSDNDARSFIFGATSYLMLPDRPAAVKTGTTNDFHDAWTIGYTPSLVTGVWVGNNNNDAMKEGADGSKIAAPIWNKFMREALKGAPAETFHEPDPILVDKPILNGVLFPGIKVKIDRVSGKLATEYTPGTYIEERTYQEIHDTLFYIDKDNPQGPPPGDPSADPQFQNWEEAVKKWAEANGIFNESPPTEYDDSHTAAAQPTVYINYPQNDAQINTRQFVVNVTTSAPRGVIKRTEFLIDGKILATTFGQNNLAEIVIDNSFEQGQHALEVRAYDDINNRGVTTINFWLTAPPDPKMVSWIWPRESTTLKMSDFPLEISIKLYDGSILNVSFTATSDKRDFFVNIGNAEIFSSEARLVWPTAPLSGTYRLEVKGNTSTDSFALLPSISLIIQ